MTAARSALATFVAIVVAVAWASPDVDAEAVASCGEAGSGSCEMDDTVALQLAKVSAHDNLTARIGFISQCQEWSGGGNEKSPIFKNRAELLRSKEWSKYFELVYGEVPTTRYPICVGSLWFLNKDAMMTAGITSPKINKCPKRAGDAYEFMNKYQPPWAAWIHHPAPFGIDGKGLPAHTWIEISHKAEDRETFGMWFFFSMGSGVWFNTGNTAVYNEHDDAKKVLCPDLKKCRDVNMLIRARKKGLSSLQFLLHRDDQWRCSRRKRSMGIEVVSLYANGHGACATVPETFRAGWNADKPCDCQSNAGYTNCKL